MFGISENENTQNAAQPAQAAHATPTPAITDMRGPGGAMAAMPLPATPSNPLEAQATNNPISAGGGDNYQLLASDPVVNTPAPEVPQSAQNVNPDSLLALKKEALDNLAPLVGHLDQSPEEKFKTTMMLIQASDNAGLVKQAYEAAREITDEKARAQALIDVVNEINYFTQHGGQT